MERKVMAVEESYKEYTRRIRARAMRETGRRLPTEAMHKETMREMAKELDEPSIKALQRRIEVGWRAQTGRRTFPGSRYKE